MTTKDTEAHDATPADRPLALRLSEGLGLPVAAYDAGGEVLIEAARQRDGRTLWKVRRGPSCLGKDGQWEYEPLPSSRDDEFFARCRFDTPQEALACLCAVRSGQQA